MSYLSELLRHRTVPAGRTMPPTWRRICLGALAAAMIPATGDFQPPAIAQFQTESRTDKAQKSVVLQKYSPAEVAQALKPFLTDDVSLLIDAQRHRVVLEGRPAQVQRMAELIEMMEQRSLPANEAKFVQQISGNSGSNSSPVPKEPGSTNSGMLGQSLPSGSLAPARGASASLSVLTAESDSAPQTQIQRWLYLAADSQATVSTRLQQLLGAGITQQSGVFQWSSPGGGRVQFQFDTGSDQLSVAGQDRLVKQLIQLVQSIQQEQNGSGEVQTRLIRASHSTVQHLEDVRQNLASAPAAAHTPRPMPAQEGPALIRPVSFLEPIMKQESLPPAQDNNESTNSPGQQPSLPDFGGNIDVETLPDLDVLILRGREQDLQQLADIIEQLEAISKQTQPEVEVYHLQHTSASAMATILGQVNSELIRGRQGRVTVTSIEKPNALLLIGWGDAVVATKDLIAKLDQPVDPATEFKAFRLKNATAALIQQTLQQFLNNRSGLGTSARVIADQRTNSLIVNAAPRDMVEIAQLVSELDVAEGMARNRAEVIQPQHMLASDLAETLRLTVNAIQQGDSRSGILELLTIDENGAETIRSGALRDVTITAQPRNNSILISAPPHSMPLLKSLIEQLDQPTSTAQMKIFRIVHSDAASIVLVLRSLLPSETAVGQPYRLPNSGDATSLVPLRFSIDTRTNSVLAIGNPEDLAVVEALVLRLDEEGGLERKSVVYHLKNAPARDIAAAINEFLVNQRQLNLAAPGSVNPYQQLEQEVIIVPEPVGNRLILSATNRYFDEISQLIQKLDEAPPQVMIQVLIAEVTLNNADEFGIELGIQDSVLFDRSLLGDLLTTVNTTTTSTQNGVVTVTEEVVQSATNIPGFNFNSTSDLGNSGSDASLATSGSVGGQGISNFSVGRVNSELGFGGLVLSASSRNVSALLRALQESRRLEILSRPQIRSLDNQPAYIQVGQRVPRIIGSTVNQNGQTNTVALENVGLIMGVTPRISPDGTVVMEVDAEKSQLGPESEGIPVSVSSDGTIIRSPRIDTTTAQTTVSAASGETIVLGGLITKSTQEVHRKVPWLGDVPIVRNLFRFDSNIGKRTELVIILTPHVIRSSLDSDRIREIELARMSWCAADVYEIHGDVHAGGPYYDLEADTEIVYPDGAPPELPELVPLEPVGSATKPLKKP